MALPDPLQVPNTRVAIAGNAPASSEYREFFRKLVEYLGTAGVDPAVLAEIQARLDDLEQNENNFSILGLMSVTVIGTPHDGLVQVSLENDVSAPGNGYFYGTDAAGNKTFVPAADVIAGADSVSKAVGGDGVSTLSLVGDSAAPGANRFYGTDGAGAKGWQILAATSGVSFPVALHLASLRL